MRRNNGSHSPLGVTVGRLLVLVCFGYFCSLGDLQADYSPAVTLTGTPTNFGGTPLDQGWAFTVNSSIIVDALGFFDAPFISPLGAMGTVGDGLSLAHDVTLFLSTGVIVASGTIPSGTLGTLVDGFRYSSITPIVLVPGDYVISASYTGPGADPDLETTGAFSSQAMITVTAGRVDFNDDGFPEFVTNDPRFGPNMSIQATPEPSPAWFGVTLGAAILLSRQRRKEQVS